MRAIPADFGSCKLDLEPELRPDLGPQALQLLAEKFFHTPAAEADDVRVLLLEAGFVIMLIALNMRQIQFVDQAALLEQLSTYGRR